MSLLLNLVRDDGLSLLVISHRWSTRCSSQTGFSACKTAALPSIRRRQRPTLPGFGTSSTTPSRMSAFAPTRFQHRSLVECAAMLAVLALVVTSLAATAPALDKLGSGIARLFAPSAC